MYGLMAACIAMMALFLGLFAMSVDPQSSSIEDQVAIISTPAVAAERTANSE